MTDFSSTVPETATYPLVFDVDEATGPRNRATVFFRAILQLPITILYTAVIGAYGGAIQVFGPLLMILFRKKYPRWWFDWNLGLLRFHNRILVYTLLLHDEYPSTDDLQAVHLDVKYPDAETELTRGLPLVKWLLAIPHYIVLFFLYIGAFFVLIASWFAILFTGHLPAGMFDYQVGVMRWWNRVAVYAFLMMTDEYPPFTRRP